MDDRGVAPGQVPRDAILAGWRFEHPSLGDGHAGRRRRRRQGSGHVQDVPLGDDYSWGCGYPGDKETVRWMRANLHPLFGEPPPPAPAPPSPPKPPFLNT